jgi:hypothetical protein
MPWDHRQTIASAMNLALGDDDVNHYCIYRDLFDQANNEMHAVLQEGLPIAAEKDWDIRATPKFGGNSSPTEPISSAASNRQFSSLPEQSPTVLSSHDSTGPISNEESNRRVSGLPAQPQSVFTRPAPSNLEDVRWRAVNSLPFVESAPRRHLRQSFKETDHSFEIFVSYQGVII